MPHCLPPLFPSPRAAPRRSTHTRTKPSSQHTPTPLHGVVRARPPDARVVRGARRQPSAFGPSNTPPLFRGAPAHASEAPAAPSTRSGHASHHISVHAESGLRGVTHSARPGGGRQQPRVPQGNFEVSEVSRKFPDPISTPWQSQRPCFGLFRRVVGLIQRPCRSTMSPVREPNPEMCDGLPRRRNRVRQPTERKRLPGATWRLPAQAAENAERRELVPIRRKGFDPGF